jgi:hypothetical protein
LKNKGQFAAAKEMMQKAEKLDPQIAHRNQ